MLNFYELGRVPQKLFALVEATALLGLNLKLLVYLSYLELVMSHWQSLSYFCISHYSLQF